MRLGLVAFTLALLLLLPGWPVVPLCAEPPFPETGVQPEDPEPEVAPPAAGDILLAPGSHLIPWERLDEEAFTLARDVVTQASVFRRVDGIAYRSRKEVFDYLIEHLDFAADLARALGEGRHPRVRRAPGGFEADDGRWLLRPLYRGEDQRVFYLQARYEPKLLPAVAGRLVLVLETPHTRAPDGENYVEIRAAGFLRLDNAFAETIAAVTGRLSEAAVERRVKRFFGRVARVSRRASDDPEGLAEELARHPDLPPDQVAEFRQILLAHRLPAWAEAIPFRLTSEPLTLDAGDPLDPS